jgi:hypothetical protein
MQNVKLDRREQQYAIHLLPVIERMLQLLSSEKKWTKGCMARDHTGTPLVSPHGSAACSFCLVGAKAAARPSMGLHAALNGLLIKVLRSQGKPYNNLANFNDAGDTCYKDVVHLLTSTRDLLRSHLS